jgi:murein DD-endopeptidase MepM/ murein hydrolase activator NlpD
MQSLFNCQIQHRIKSGDTLYSLAKKYNTSIDEIYALNPMLNPYYLTIGQIILIPCSINVNNRIYDLSNKIRMLWEQHIAWTRMTIVDLVYDLPETSFAIKRLLRNPEDFARLLEPLYGKDVANNFASLLKDHLVIAADLVKAAKINDTAKVEETTKKWFKNADDIARFLSTINPYWQYDEWQKMLYNHLNLVKIEAVNFLNKQFEPNTLLYDEMERQAMEMADYMTFGIVKQFPNIFM